MESTKPLISVIVPVYNVESFINRCLDAIISQTYKNWEAILIDDGSTDNSGKICDEYAGKDSRFRVIHQRNGGVSRARNIGISAVTGKYITFCDPDDYYNPETLKNLIDCFAEKDIDIAMCNYCFINEDNEIEHKNKMDLSQKVYSHEELIKIIMLGNIRSYLWNKMFKAQLFSGSFFAEDLPYEDSILLPDIFHKAKNCTVIDYEGYVYFRFRQGNISTSKKLLNELALCKAAIVRYELAKKHYEKYLNITAKQVINGYVNLNIKWKRKDIKSELEKNLWEETLLFVKEIKSSNKLIIPSNIKVRMWAALYMPYVLNFLGKIKH